MGGEGNMKYKAVIFDMDGTIVNSIFGIMHSMNNVLARHGLELINVDQCKSFVGNGIKELVRKVAGINSPDDPCWSSIIVICSKSIQKLGLPDVCLRRYY